MPTDTFSHPEPNDDELADLLDEAIALEGEARDEFLRGLEARNPSRARELRELLAVLPDPEPRETADRAERGESDPFVGEPAVGETIGGCRLDEVLGRGGIGTVYGAHQIDPPRAVAVKVLRLSGARASHLRRFRTEAYALGRLLHPALARIYASGAVRREGVDVPYIVMERIEGGRSFVDWAREPRVTRREIALRMAEVCDGMQHGHNRGVIHRDLKPTNILIGAEGLPHVIDFGIARLVSGEQSAADETAAGALIGTPAYMAPEQFELAPVEIDARIDIHALGVILYESLTGRRPYDIPRHLYFDAAHIMRSEQPALPTLVDSTIPRDLSAIVMKAMAEDRDRRYASMSELADDLRAFAQGRGVRARPESGPERLFRTARRNPAWTTAILVSSLALATAAIVSFRALGQSRAQLRRAEVQLATVAVERGDIPLAGERPMDLDAIEPQLVGRMIRRTLDQSVHARVAAVEGHLMAGSISPDRRRWVASSEGDGFVLVDAEGLAPSIGKSGGPSGMYATGFSWDGSRAFAGDSDGELIELLPGGGSRKVATLGGYFRGIAPCADGDRLLLVSATAAGLYSLSTGRYDAVAIAEGVSLGGLAWNGTGTAYAVMGDRRVHALEIPASGPPARIPGFSAPVADARAVGVSADGRMVAIGSNSGAVLLVDPDTGALVRRVSVHHSVWSVAFSRDGEVLYAGERSGRIHVIGVADGVERAVWSVFSLEPVWAIAETSDGRVIANIGTEMHCFSRGYEWSRTPQPLPARPRAFSVLDARTVRAIGGDAVIRELDLGRGTWTKVASVADAFPALPIECAALSADGSMAAVSDGTRVVTVDLRSGARAVCTETDALGAAVHRLAWTRDGSRLAAAGRLRITVLDRDAKVVLSTSQSTGELDDLLWVAPDHLAHLPTVNVRRDYRFADGGVRASESQVCSMTRLIYTGGRWVLPLLNGIVGACYANDPTAIGRVDGEFEFRLNRHRDYALAAAASPDRAVIATGGADGSVRLFSLRDGEPITAFSAMSQQIYFLDWLPDGSGMVAMGTEGELGLFDSISRAERIARDAAAADSATPRP